MLPFPNKPEKVSPVFSAITLMADGKEPPLTAALTSNPRLYQSSTSTVRRKRSLRKRGQKAPKGKMFLSKPETLQEITEVNGEDTFTDQPEHHEHPRPMPTAPTHLQAATFGFRKVSPSRCTSFMPSFRSRVWLLSGSLQLSRHWSTTVAVGKAHCSA